MLRKTSVNDKENRIKTTCGSMRMLCLHACEQSAPASKYEHATRNCTVLIKRVICANIINATYSDSLYPAAAAAALTVEAVCSGPREHKTTSPSFRSRPHFRLLGSSRSSVLVVVVLCIYCILAQDKLHTIAIRWGLHIVGCWQNFGLENKRFAGANYLFSIVNWIQIFADAMLKYISERHISLKQFVERKIARRHSLRNI